MTSPLVSCIVPVYNGEAFLSDALDSILAQDYRPIEIIVVDDGSTDRTAQIVAGYGDEVQYIWQKNAGPGAARNRGISIAAGKFICFLDADDLWVTNRISRALSRLRDHPDLDYVVCHAQNFWVEELANEWEAYRDRSRGRPIPAYTSAGMLTRSGSFRRVGLFDPRLSHSDSADWFLRAKAEGLRGELLDDVLVRRRIHPASRSRRLRRESQEEFLRLAKRSIDRRREASSPGNQES